MMWDTTRDPHAAVSQANDDSNIDCSVGRFATECIFPTGINKGATDMKKTKTAAIDQTRRRFMAYFSSLGLGATLVPGVLWARMQDVGAQTITLAMVTDA